MKKYIIFLLAILMIFAGDKTKIGTAGGQLLQINSTPRGMALGDAHFATVGGIEAIFYNPAGLNTLSNMEFTVSSMNYLFDTNLNQLAFGLKLGEFTAIAFGYKNLAIGDIAVSTYEAKEGTGEIINPSNSHLSITYSQQFTDKISFGITTGLYSEDNVGVTGNSMTLDMGIQYHTKSGVSIGLAIKNLGSDISYTGDKIQTNQGADRTPFSLNYEDAALPTEFKLSLSYTRDLNEDNSLMFSGNFTNANQGLNQIVGSLEYTYVNSFFGRFSYTSQEESGFSLWSGVAGGIGVNFSAGENSSLSFDYAFRSIKESAIGNGVHSFGASLTF